MNQTDELLSLSDLDFQPGCEGSKTLSCPLPAAWTAITSCCGFHCIFCEKHKAIMQMFWGVAPMLIPLSCDQCNFVHKVDHPFFARFERL